MNAVRILIVEDEPGIALALEVDLTLEGYQVTVVREGPAAVKTARENAFDAILLDVMLPGKDGFEVCRELRRSGIRTPIRDLWLSGSSTHPGGGLMGANGRLAALEVLKARGRRVA